MTAIGTITNKNQLTIPKHILDMLSLDNSKKVLLYYNRNSITIKPIPSSVEALAGSLGKRIKTYGNDRYLERELLKKSMLSK